MEDCLGDPLNEDVETVCELPEDLDEQTVGRCVITSVHLSDVGLILEPQDRRRYAPVGCQQ